MAKARYTIFVPGGGPIAMAAHQYLMESRLPIESATVHSGVPFDSLVAYAEETPEMDSHMKQVGTYVGEVANQPVITVAKEGKTVATWPMKNLHYQPPVPSPLAPPEQPPAPPAASDQSPPQLPQVP